MSLKQQFWSVLKSVFKKTLVMSGLAGGLWLTMVTPALAQADIFGTIEAPEGVRQYNAQGENNIGLIPFISTLIRVATIIAGIWVMINFILAGYTYITSQGDPGAHSKVTNKLTMSIIGIMLIVGSYTIAALIGMIVFGDPGYILSPTIQGV